MPEIKTRDELALFKRLTNGNEMCQAVSGDNDKARSIESWDEKRAMSKRYLIVMSLPLLQTWTGREGVTSLLTKGE